MQPKLTAASAFAIGGAVLWGLVEFMALFMASCRSRWAAAWRHASRR
jgi:hypothetical protein